MFKFFVIALLFSGSTYLGYYFGEVFKYRSKQLKELQKALVLMNSEILYTNTSLSIVFSNVGKKISGPFSNIYLDLSRKLDLGEVESVYEGYSVSYEKYKGEIFLKKEDLNIVEDFFNVLGESGIYGQEKIFNLTVERIGKNYEAAEHEVKINSKMYRTLGLCLGAVFAIFFI